MSCTCLSNPDKPLQFTVHQRPLPTGWCKIQVFYREKLRSTVCSHWDILSCQKPYAFSHWILISPIHSVSVNQISLEILIRLFHKTMLGAVNCPSVNKYCHGQDKKQWWTWAPFPGPSCPDKSKWRIAIIPYLRTRRPIPGTDRKCKHQRLAAAERLP